MPLVREDKMSKHCGRAKDLLVNVFMVTLRTVSVGWDEENSNCKKLRVDLIKATNWLTLK